MTKILFGFTVVAACVALLWAGIAGAQPGPPNPVPPGRVLAQCQANLDTCEASAFVPQTGQTQCYDGQTPDECPNGPFGQDGDIQAGVPFPNPRFTVNNPDGTVTDNLTGLIWLQDANCFEARTWTEALDDANTLNGGECSLTDGSAEEDWRLPNVRELQSLIHYGFFDPALSNAADTAKWTTDDDAFAKVVSSNYWSSTTDENNPVLGWGVNFFVGDLVSDFKTENFWVLPVRGP